MSLSENELLILKGWHDMIVGEFALTSIDGAIQSDQDVPSGVFQREFRGVTVAQMYQFLKGRMTPEEDAFFKAIRYQPDDEKGAEGGE